MATASTPRALIGVAVTVVTKRISRAQNVSMWMSAGKARLPASLIVSTRWAATRVPVPGDMSSTEMAKHAGIWMSVPPCDTVVSRFVRTPRGATAAAVRQATGWRPTSAEI